MGITTGIGNLTGKDNEKNLPFPTSKGVEDFFAGPFVKGIGKIYAGRIAEKIGKDFPESIKDLEKILESVPGIGGKKIKEILQSLEELKYPPALLAFLYSCGLSDAWVMKILSHYKKDTATVILEDPYQMVEEVFKLPFAIADKIGNYLKIPADNPGRIKGALLTAVRIYAEKGHMFAREEEAVTVAGKIAGLEKELIIPRIKNLIEEQRLVKSLGGLYLPVYFTAEREGAEKLSAIMRAKREKKTEFPLPTHDKGGNLFSEDQLKAIKAVIDNPVSVITGGPGTGKTTTVRGIIKLLEDCEKEVILVAPTGRAAKRMSDLTGHEAKTLHRLLGYTQGHGYRNKHFPADVIVIDEASMLEQVMFNHLLQAIGEETKIVLVGDTDQLPAIGAGDVLRDLIKSGTVPVVTLKENFRHKEGGVIAANAAAIKEGQMPSEEKENEFILLAENTSGKIHDRLLNFVAEELPERYHINAKDIQVVTPLQEGPLGAKQLNRDIQEAVNPDAPEIKRGLKRFRLGDRVMQVSNSSIRNTFNGETGWISQIDKETDSLEVTFYDGKKSKYCKKDLGELALAYAMTVHKLQGSETDYMVMLMSMGHKPMLYRNLLYTGVSRAKKLCVLIGEEKALKTAVDNPSPSVRNSNFKKRLQESLPAIYK